MQLSVWCTHNSIGSWLAMETSGSSRTVVSYLVVTPIFSFCP